SVTRGLVEDSCDNVAIAVVAGTPAFQSLARTLATAVPPAGDGTWPVSSLAITAWFTSPVERQRKTPRPELTSAGSPTGSRPNDPPRDTEAVPAPTPAQTGKPAGTARAGRPRRPTASCA